MLQIYCLQTKKHANAFFKRNRTFYEFFEQIYDLKVQNPQITHFYRRPFLAFRGFESFKILEFSEIFSAQYSICFIVQSLLKI